MEPEAAYNLSLWIHQRVFLWLYSHGCFNRTRQKYLIQPSCVRECYTWLDNIIPVGLLSQYLSYLSMYKWLRSKPQQSRDSSSKSRRQSSSPAATKPILWFLSGRPSVRNAPFKTTHRVHRKTPALVLISNGKMGIERGECATHVGCMFPTLDRSRCHNRSMLGCSSRRIDQRNSLRYNCMDKEHNKRHGIGWIC